MSELEQAESNLKKAQEEATLQYKELQQQMELRLQQAEEKALQQTQELTDQANRERADLQEQAEQQRLTEINQLNAEFKALSEQLELEWMEKEAALEEQLQQAKEAAASQAKEAEAAAEALLQEEQGKLKQQLEEQRKQAEARLLDVEEQLEEVMTQLISAQDMVAEQEQQLQHERGQLESLHHEHGVRKQEQEVQTRRITELEQQLEQLKRTVPSCRSFCVKRNRLPSNPVIHRNNGSRSIMKLWIEKPLSQHSCANFRSNMHSLNRKPKSFVRLK